MPSSPARSFGALLKRHRHAANLTQEELAERAGISVDTISALERGVNLRPRQDTLDQLADALALAPAQRTHLQAAARGLLWTGPSPATVHHRAAAGAALPPLVGRAQELAHLEQHLAGDGPPVFLLAGEPGIGKSRLLHETAQQASEQGWTVLTGGCHHRSSQDPYTPMLTALEGRLRGQPAAQTRRELEGCAWLVRLLPELAERRLVPAPSWTLSPEQERRLLFAAVARYLANIAGPAGTLLVLDDLHWAGADALDLLSSLLRTPTETPVRLLGAYRSTEVRAADPMGGLVAEWARAGLATQHPLEALVAPDARALLDSLLAGEEAIAPTVREQVLTRTGGVPYFLVSCAQALRVPGPAEISQNVPWDVAQSIRQRAAALPQGAQDLLGIAAIAGRRAPRRLLLSVAGAWGQRPRETLAALEAACQARLLVEEGTVAYVFPHDLIHDVLLADLSAARQAALHQQAAEALAQLPERLREGRAAELAWHWQEAGEAERALPWALRAGSRRRMSTPIRTRSSTISGHASWRTSWATSVRRPSPGSGWAPSWGTWRATARRRSSWRPLSRSIRG